MIEPSRFAWFHFRAPMALFGCLVACDGSSSNGREADASVPKVNEVAGQPCQMLETSFQCPANAWYCYGGGNGSSCPGGVLCVGDGSGMTCAYSCAQDSDCAVDGSTAVCMLGCKERLLNGYCMSALLREKLLETACPTGSLGNIGVTGTSN
jgi:hypothetical protein